VYKFTVCKYGLISSVNLKDFKKSEVSFPYSELPVDTTIWKNKVTQDKILILRSYEKTFVLQKNNYHDKKFKSIWRTIRNYGTMKSSKYVLLKLTKCITIHIEHDVYMYIRLTGLDINVPDILDHRKASVWMTNHLKWLFTLHYKGHNLCKWFI